MCRKRFLILLPVLMLFVNSTQCTLQGAIIGGAIGAGIKKFVRYVVVPACLITGGVFVTGCVIGFLAGHCKCCKRKDKDDQEEEKALFCTVFTRTLGALGSNGTGLK